MQGLKTLRIPLPSSTGAGLIIVSLLAFAAGYIRNELVLTLLGTVFIAMLFYCFLTLVILGFLHHKKTLEVHTEIITKQVKVFEEGELHFPHAKKLFLFPGTIARYNMVLATKDGRQINLIINPRKNEDKYIKFNIPGRGVYHNNTENLLFLDMPGLFKLKLPINNETIPKLYAIPVEAEETLPLQIRSGGSEKRSQVNYRKTDILTESRPYVPGDDPRRINWKLYGHGSDSELYVREGENSPPPHSRLLILIDTQIDPVLFSMDEGRDLIDLLCKYALKTANDLSQKGIEVFVGHTGSDVYPLEAAALAAPYALPMLSDKTLPKALENAGTMILAVPRLYAGQSLSGQQTGSTTLLSTALDKFLADFNSRTLATGAVSTGDKQLDLIFLYTIEEDKMDKKNTKEREEASRACTAYYRRKKNVFARSYAVGSSSFSINA